MIQASDRALRDSYAFCREVARRRGRNFYYGMKLTPEPKRSALYAFYAWNRRVDDLADEPGPVAQKQARLLRFRTWTEQMVHPAGPSPSGDDDQPAIWAAVAETVQRYGIPLRYLQGMIEGQLLDQTQTRYGTFAELRDYCYKVAGTVGLVCLRIWGLRGNATAGDQDVADAAAVDRGLALQLTNILRDLAEDARRDRVYLPADDLRRFGLDVQALRSRLLDGGADRALDELMEFEIARARECYERSAALEALVHPEGRAACWTMMRIYRCLLERIARDPRQVLRRRVRLSPLRKAAIAWRAVTGQPWGA